MQVLPGHLRLYIDAMELVFAYLAGLLTLINPCVLPVLPIVLASSLNADRRGPVLLAAGMSLSFVTFGMLVTTVGHAIGLTEQRLAEVGAVAMMLFGAVLLVPRLSARFETAMAGVSARADSTLTQNGGQGLVGQFLGGLLLGAVWSPCIGPTLGGGDCVGQPGAKPVLGLPDHGGVCRRGFDADPGDRDWWSGPDSQTRQCYCAALPPNRKPFWVWSLWPSA